MCVRARTCVSVTQRMWDCNYDVWVCVGGFCGMVSESVASSVSFYFHLNVGIYVILCRDEGV